MSNCPRCGTAFECGMADAAKTNEPCWCTRLPVLPPESYTASAAQLATGGCYCPCCLRALLAQAQDD